MKVKMPRVDPGFTYGAGYDVRPITLDEAESAEQQQSGPMTSQRKAEFRRQYWKGRLHQLLNDVNAMPRYLTLGQLERMYERLWLTYYAVLMDYYGGKAGADKFLREMDDFVKNLEPADAEA